MRALPSSRGARSSLALLRSTLALLVRLRCGLLSKGFFVVSSVLARLEERGNSSARVSSSRRRTSTPPSARGVGPIDEILSSSIGSGSVPMRGGGISVGSYRGARECCGMVCFVSNILLAIFLDCSYEPRATLGLGETVPSNFLARVLVGCSKYSRVAPSSASS